jgi:hypothetical protein
LLVPATTVLGASSEARFSHPLLAREESSLAPRADLTTALSDLVDLLKSISGLLNEQFFDDVKITVTGLADLLAAPFANETRTIVSKAGSLLEEIDPLLDTISDLDLKGLIGAVSKLLTTDNINKISKLIDTVLDLDINGLVTSVSKLLTPATIDIISGLLTKANSLLTTTFISQIKELIGDVTPLVSAVSEFVTALISALLGG